MRVSSIRCSWGSLPRLARQLAAAGLLVCLSPQIATAQSAADKATARQLATEGIRRYNEGKFDQALDDLQRAQALYDAPVHLLYIARTQVKLGKLVDASENYRRLIRTPLEDGAPPAFRDAVEAAKKELPEIEGKIPALRVQVSPANVARLELQVDGQPVSTAAIGVDRPADPGEHVVRVSAPGYEPAEATVSLRPGERKAVALTLKPAPGQAVPAADSPSAAPSALDPARDGTAAPRPAASTKQGSYGFVIGLRAGGGALSGNLTEDIAMSDAAQGAGGAGLYFGMRFLKYFTGMLVLDGFVVKPGSAFDLQREEIREGDYTQADNTASMTQVGLGARVGTPVGRFGGFGQIEVLPAYLLNVTSERKRILGDCSAEIAYSGAAFRVGGGLAIPVMRWLQITPIAHWTIGKYSDVEVSGDCPNIPIPGRNDNESGAVEKAGTHSLFFLGVGGEYLFGPDKPSR